MNKINKISLASILIYLLSTFGPVAYAYDEDYYSYDQIVRGLSSKAPAPRKISEDPFSQVKIHSGIAAATSFLDLRDTKVAKPGTPVRGIQVSLGIDLFSPQWMAEGTMRTLSDHMEDQSEISLKEFELKLVYRTTLSRFLDFRGGIGMAGRYLRHSRREALDPVSPATSDGLSEAASSSYRIIEDHQSTLASVFVGGVDAYINNTFSLGAEIGYRSSLIEGSLDNKAVDALLRFDVHF
ncbi:MAG: hypothetical protein H6626_06495 [Pseudobdellovibrionaceae bacterium]|nr:hypothetical protein [Bdellovibrionales bacterium]USN48735.1 MAG: hypothetical protein H6626_06495 [Pseudobdellovibrionaceae bacterium]